MNRHVSSGAAVRLAVVLVVTWLLAACATTAPPSLRVVEPKPSQRTVLAATPIDPAIEDRILALDPLHVSRRDIDDVLSKAPAPRIMLVHGGVYPVHLAMSSFGTFLTGMGYPEQKIREPAGGEWSYSPYTSSSRLAGILAWHYEQDGLRPMIVGHSQGGLYAVKILKELAGQYGPALPVWNPIRDQPEERTTIVDPLTDEVRPVIGVSASYAAAVGAGGWALVLPHQWDDFANLRRIPDTVDEFTGYFIEVDLFALSFPGNPLDVPYQPNGAAKVRNVTLPAVQNHVFTPVTADLLESPKVRAWLDEYAPVSDIGTVTPPSDASGNAIWAADVWYAIKKHWVIEAQRFVRARRATLGR